MSKTIADLHAEVMGDLRESYLLVQVARGDGLNDAQVDALVRGEDYTGSCWEYLFEWAEQSAFDAARWWVNDHAQDVLRRWARASEDYAEDVVEQYEASEEWDAAVDAIRERDSSLWLRDLAANSGQVLLRVPLLGEDDQIDPEHGTPQSLLTACGLPVDEHNLAAAAALLDEAPTSVRMVYVMAAVSVADMMDLPTTGQVRVTGPHLYLGNPFTGAAWVEGPFHGSLIVERHVMRTDDDAFGYSWAETTGGVVVSAYEAQFEPVQ